MNQKKHRIKTWLITLFVAITFVMAAKAQTGELVTSVEAEVGVLTGVSIASSISGYSGTGYVTGFDSSGDQLTVTVTVPEKAFYLIMIRYHSNDYKSQNISINGAGATGVDFNPNNGFSFANGGKHILLPGENTISIQNSWGWTEIDKFEVYTTETNNYEKTAKQLVDSKASVNTKSVYNFLFSQFGKRIISGQFFNHFNELINITGKTPLYKVWDFQAYTEGYSWLWKNGGFAFGIPSNLDITEQAIAWYKSTGKKGIVGFQWHWHSPSGGTVGTNTFYNESTTFDVREAVKETSPNYALLIRDIDAIAVEIKKLEAENIPVIFRPLHEAGGGWFWWSGTKDEASAEACKKLYRMIFDRLKDYHHIHNIIWAWSTYEQDWYPGNDIVDIVGMDSYPGENNYTTQKNTFDRYFDITNGEKIVAMTENGAIPDPDDCLDLDAPWSFFMSWGDMVVGRNETSHLVEVFSNPRVITIESDTFPLIINADSKVLCNSGVITLEAEASFGEVNWYAEAGSDSIIHSGKSFETPEISATKTYYVEASYNNNPSELARIPVTVKVTTLIKEASINGISEICQGTTNVLYSLPSDSTANDYSWQLPEGATLVSGANTNSVLVDYGESAVSGTIRATGENECGSGFENTLNVTVNPIPNASYISNNEGVLESSVTSGNQWYFNNNLIESETTNVLTPNASGDYYSIITLNNCVSEPSNTLSYTLTSANEIGYGNKINIYPNPLKKGTSKIMFSGLIFGNRSTAQIFDMNGRLIQSSRIEKNELYLNDEIKSGIYVIKVLSAGKTFDRSLIVQ